MIVIHKKEGGRLKTLHYIRGVCWALHCLGLRVRFNNLNVAGIITDVISASYSDISTLFDRCSNLINGSVWFM